MIKQINVRIDEDVINKFRATIYQNSRLRRGDFKNAVRVPMLDYIMKYSKLETTKEFAKRAKSDA